MSLWLWLSSLWPPLTGHVETVLGAGSIPSRHDLDVGEPDVARQGGLSRPVQHLVQGKDGHQRPAQAGTAAAHLTLGMQARPPNLLTVGQPPGKGLHVGVPDAAAVGVYQEGFGFDEGGGVREVQVVAVGDVGPVQEAANLPDQGLPEHIDGTVGGHVQELEVFKEGGSGPAPVVGALVAAAVPGIGVDEVVDGAQDPKDVLRPGLDIVLDGQNTGQPVGADPGIPVVDAPAAQPAHPEEVDAHPEHVQDPPPDFQFDASAHQRRDGVQPLVQQVQRPGQQRAGLGRKQVDGRFLHVRQAGAGLLDPDVGRNAPVGFLAKGPDAVDAVVQETALPFGAFGQHQIGQGIAPGVAQDPGSGSGCPSGSSPGIAWPAGGARRSPAGPRRPRSGTAATRRECRSRRTVRRHGERGANPAGIAADAPTGQHRTVG